MIKNIKYFYFVILSLGLSSIHCRDYSKSFEYANSLYRDGKFNDAMSVYEKIPNKNFQINYNLGNCAYKLGYDGLALLYWRRAEGQWGLLGRGELLENISLLKARRFGKISKKTKGLVVKELKWVKNYFVSLVRSAPLFFFQFSFLLLWFLLFLFLRKLYQNRNRFLIVSMFGFILIFGLSLVLRYSFSLSRYGVVIGKTSIMSGPSKTFQYLGTIPEAKEVLILKSSGDYFKIRFNGQAGWVSKKYVKKIIDKD